MGPAFSSSSSVPAVICRTDECTHLGQRGTSPSVGLTMRGTGTFDDSMTLSAAKRGAKPVS